MVQGEFDFQSDYWVVHSHRLLTLIYHENVRGR